MKTMKTMKSALRAASLLLMATVLSFSMASCESDDAAETVNPTPVNHGELKKAVTTVTVIPSEDSKKISEITVEFLDSAGNKQVATVGETLFLKVFEFDGIPAEGGIVVRQKLRDGAQLTKDKYEIGATVVLVFSGKFADGTYCEAAKTQLGRSRVENVTKDNVGKHLLENPVFYSTKFVISKDASGKTVTAKEKKFEDTSATTKAIR